MRQNKDIAIEQYQQIQSQIEVYKTILKQKDQEIERLKDVNEDLLTAVTDLKVEKNKLNENIYSLKKDKMTLEEKVKTASALQIEKVQFVGVDKRGKEKAGNSFRARQIKSVKIRFVLEPNVLAEPDVKSIILRLVDPEGTVLTTNKLEQKSFRYQEKDLFYTHKEDVLFDGTAKSVAVEYKRQLPFMKGFYRLELYHNANLVQEKSFMVK